MDKQPLKTKEMKKLKWLLIQEIQDTRDPRGKRHDDLAAIIVSVIFAILVGKKSLSSIHRYMALLHDSILGQGSPFIYTFY